MKKDVWQKKNHGKYEINVDYKDYHSSYKDPFIIFVKKKHKQTKDNIRALKQRKNLLLNFQVTISKKFVVKYLNIIAYLLIF